MESQVETIQICIPTVACFPDTHSWEWKYIMKYRRTGMY